MADESKEFWDKMRGKVRRALDLDPLCQEESEKEYKKTKPAGPLPETDIDAIMEFAQSFGESGGMAVEPEQEEEDEPAADWTDPVKAEDMDAELMELVNRNRGDQDEETDDLLDKHRNKELGDDEQNGEDEDADDRQNTP
jgi:hypothetical protein